MDKQRFSERLEDFHTATKRLAEACQQPETSFMRDSAILRFKHCWVLVCKVLRFKLDELGVQANNPRDIFKEAIAVELISDGNLWSEAQRMRNLTSHTYDEALAAQVYAFIKQDGLHGFIELSKSSADWKP